MFLETMDDDHKRRRKVVPPGDDHGLGFNTAAEKFIDLTIPFVAGKGTAFGLEAPEVRSLLPKEIGVRADRISFCAHASGTHTECIGHINLQDDLSATFAALPPIVSCLVLHVKPDMFGTCGGDSYAGSIPAPEPNELVVSRQSLEKAIADLKIDKEAIKAYAVLVYTGTCEWVFFTDQAVEFLVQRGATALLVDQVSIDRERCGPAMPAHRGFFHGRKTATITENVKYDGELKEGLYHLNLQLAPFLGTDAVPSRVILLSAKGGS
jgi:arylformamidase